MKIYHYCIYGITISSNFPISELSLKKKKKNINVYFVERKPDSIIHHFPKKEGWLIDQHIYIQIFENEILLSINAIGKISIGTNEIIIQKLPSTTPDEVKMHILGTAMAIFLLKKGIFSLHGSTIYKKTKSFAFVGASGAGKSTLVTHFIDQGYHLVADDISRIEVQTDFTTKVHPGISQIRLWPDSVLALNRDPQSLPLVVNKLDKRRLAIENMSQSAVELSAIILIKPSEVDQPRLYPLKGEACFSAIAENIYGASVIPFLENYAAHFQFCSALANKVPVYCLERPIGQFALESIYALVEDTLNLK